MITELHLQNFKCFEDRTIPLNNLTLLSGLNGMGKSTTIQAFLLLRQSHDGYGQITGLDLNGELTSLGTARDVRFENAQTDEMGISFVDDQKGILAWQFSIDPATDVLMVQQGPEREWQDLTQFNLFSNNFHYLNAERLGPRNLFGTSDFQVRQLRQLGAQGQYTAHFLSLFGNEDIPVAELQHPRAMSLSLRNQVEAWLSDISPGARLNLTSVPEMDIVGLRYSFTFGRNETNPYRTTNVGFGLTYTLPILVAVLSSKPGALILLENPEAHLHPKGQALMGELFARAAAAGIQMVVESHSDHVLNGIRVAVRQERVAPEKVTIHFFGRDENTGEHMLISPQIDQDGRISEWPEHFFDEYEKSLEALLMPRSDEDDEF
jgi:predicted ATPase